MDKYDAWNNVVNEWLENKTQEVEIRKEDILEIVRIVLWYFMQWIYNNNFEIIDRTISEEEIAEIKKKTPG